MSQNVVNVIRTQYQAAHHRWLEATMQGVTPEQAHWQPPLQQSGTGDSSPSGSGTSGCD